MSSVCYDPEKKLPAFIELIQSFIEKMGFNSANIRRYWYLFCFTSLQVCYQL